MSGTSCFKNFQTYTDIVKHGTLNTTFKNVQKFIPFQQLEDQFGIWCNTWFYQISVSTMEKKSADFEWFLTMSLPETMVNWKKGFTEINKK